MLTHKFNVIPINKKKKTYKFSSRAKQASQVGAVVKNPPANAADTTDLDLIPESRRSPGTGNGNPLQYSCLEDAMDRGTCQTIVHGVAKSQTRLSPHT